MAWLEPTGDDMASFSLYSANYCKNEQYLILEEYHKNDIEALRS
jgi:hypothetical protein